MGERKLKVTRADVNFKTNSIAQQIKSNPVIAPPKEPGKSNFSDNLIYPELNIPLDIPIFSSVPSRVIHLVNMINAEVVMDDADYREIVEDVRTVISS